MRLVGHHDDVAAVRQGCVALLKLLYGGEDDASALAVAQYLAQLLPARSLYRLLTQKIHAAAELSEELVVKVLAVGNNHYRNLWQTLHQLVSIEHHRETFARPLRVPEHADLSVALNSSLGSCHRLANSEVLMVGSKNF